jgi:16S rRNA processing protein RimM
VADADRPNIDRLEVGRIGKPHGLKGEVHVIFSTDRPERWQAGAQLFSGERVLQVLTARSHQGRQLVHFDGIDDRDAAEALRGLVLSADALPPTGDELQVHDVVGLPVRDRSGTTVGVVAALEANPAHDLLVLEDGALVPSVFVVDRDERGLVVDLPEGLLEINRRDPG